MSNEILGNPFCRWVIAMKYYDGAVSGVGLRNGDDSLIFFQAVAWDSEQWDRIFVICPIAERLVSTLRDELEKAEPARVNFWLPGPASNTPGVLKAWSDIVSAAIASGDKWCIVETHDLLQAAIESPLSSRGLERARELVRKDVVLDIVGEPLLEGFLSNISTA